MDAPRVDTIHYLFHIPPWYLYPQSQMKQFCSKCKNKTCIAEGQPCKAVNNYLARLQSKEGYSERWVRAKEIPFSNDFLEDLIIRKFHKRLGKPHKD